MAVIEIQNHQGEATRQLAKIAQALVGGCVAADLPGIDAASVAVSAGAAALVPDDRFLVIKVLLLPGRDRKPSDAGRLASVLAAAAATQLDPSWGLLVVVTSHGQELGAAHNRTKGSRVAPTSRNISVFDGEGLVEVPPPPDPHADYWVGFEWLQAHVDTLHGRYVGQWVAIYRDAVIASGGMDEVDAHVRQHGLKEKVVVWEVRGRRASDRRAKG